MQKDTNEQNTIREYLLPARLYFLSSATSKRTDWNTRLVSLSLLLRLRNSVTNREEQRPGVFEKSVLSRLPEHARENAIESWWKLQNCLHEFHSSPNITRTSEPSRMRWAEHVARKGEERSAHRIMAGKRKKTWTSWKNLTIHELY